MILSKDELAEKRGQSEDEFVLKSCLFTLLLDASWHLTIRKISK
jgi:hypothetical protein